MLVVLVEKLVPGTLNLLHYGNIIYEIPFRKLRSTHNRWVNWKVSKFSCWGFFGTFQPDGIVSPEIIKQTRLGFKF